MLKPANCALVADPVTMTLADDPSLAKALIVEFTIDAPPLDAGAVQESESEPAPAVAFRAVGAPGGVAPDFGVTTVATRPGSDFPTLFVATTETE